MGRSQPWAAASEQAGGDGGAKGQGQHGERIDDDDFGRGFVTGAPARRSARASTPLAPPMKIANVEALHLKIPDIAEVTRHAPQLHPAPPPPTGPREVLQIVLLSKINHFIRKILLLDAKLF